MVSICCGNSLASSIKKICLAATIYSIWNERNKRLHDGSLREAKVVTWDIIELVRCRLMSSKNIQDNEENRGIQMEWRHLGAFLLEHVQMYCWHIIWEESL